MVDRQLTFSVLQLVALSLPAFAILLQIVVESDIPFTHEAVPITTAGLGLFLVGGIVILLELVFSTQSTVVTLALSIITLGMVGLLVGASLIGLQTRRGQQRRSSGSD